MSYESARKLLCIVGGTALLAFVAWLSSHEACDPFPDWQTAPYILPYPVGSTPSVNQAHSSTGGHRGAREYAYDFVMPIGTTVTAARAGVVAEIRMKFRDGQPGEGESNSVKIRHAGNAIAAPPDRARRARELATMLRQGSLLD